MLKNVTDVSLNWGYILYFIKYNGKGNCLDNTFYKILRYI